MGWQDDEVVAAPSWKDDEIVSDQSFLSKTAKNIIPDAKQTVQGLGEMVKGPALDIASGDIASALPKFAKMNPMQTAKSVAEPFVHPVDYFQKHPVQQTLNTLGAAGLVKGMMPGEKPPIVSGAPIEPSPEVVPMRSAPEAPTQPASRGLPVMEPGSKTGDPHALFAYNDKFGPGGTERSLYNVFGDPEHPTLKQRGWGSSISAEDAQKAGIPITGRQPNSTQWKPIEETPSEVPPKTESPPNAEPEANPIQEAKDYVQSAIPKAKEFLNKEYAKQAKDPGWANTVAKYLQQGSQNLAAKEMGGGPKHVRQIGEEGVQALGQYAIDKKIVDPRVGSIGMKERTNAINKTAGGVLGDIRKEADGIFDPQKHTIDILQPIKQVLDQDFEPGMPGANEYKTAIGLVEKSDPSPSGVAELATKLNRLANENNKIKQPTRPYTDVANIASRINNERIKQMIGPGKSAIYEEALKDFGATKKLQEFLKNKSARAMGSGSAGSVPNRIVQKFLETAGYKAGSRIAGGMAKKILASPKTAGSLPDMFKEFINQVEALDDDISHPGMAHGGVVPDIDDAVSHHLRKENDPAYRQWAAGN